MKEYLQNRTLLHIPLIILLSLIAYSNTFHSSFQFDDEAVIIKNPIIRDLSLFLEPSKAKPFVGFFEYRSFKSRYIAYLTFALNYKIHGLDVAGYHVVNLLIHIINALLIYLLIILSFRTPFLNESAIKDYKNTIAAFSALVFACHPIQTQAVTYVWQRVTSLASMFYILSLAAYMKWRLTSQNTGKGVSAMDGLKSAVWYLGSVVSAVLAMLTKEIAFTLPVVILLYELLFFGGALKRRLLFIVPFLLTMAIIPLTLTGFDITEGGLINSAGKAARAGHISRPDYLFTEMRVLVTYLRLIFLPINQNLDYDYPLHRSFFNAEVFASFIFLLTLFAAGVYLLYRSRAPRPSASTADQRFYTPEHRLVSFGIFWFFITLSVESSFIPISDVIYEHRMYLPSAGVFISLITVVVILADKYGRRRNTSGAATFAFLSIVVIVLIAATFSRNIVWKDEVNLWKDVVSKSPNKPRGYNNLGDAYYSSGRLDEAVKEYENAIKLLPNYPMAHTNLGIIYQSRNQIDKAVEHYRIAVKAASYGSAEAHCNLGAIYQSQGLIDNAIDEYLKAVQLKPAPEQYSNLGNAYRSQGLLDKAIECYHSAIKLNPYIPEIYYNLGAAYQSKGLADMAIEEYKTAARLRPGWAMPYYKLGYISLERGDLQGARRELAKALQIEPSHQEARKLLDSIN